VSLRPQKSVSKLEFLTPGAHMKGVRRFALDMPFLGVSSLDLGPLASQAASFLF
jgi:hypothetical protein